MATLSPTFEYTPLDKTRREIRLLRFERNSHISESEPVRCQIEVVDLDDDPPPVFNAISYTWGTNPRRRSIVLNGRALNVPESSEEALRNACQEHLDMPVWNDAVCINQADIPEKNHQVATMRKVYSTACNVLIWLGPSDVKTEEAFSIMTKLYRVAALNISSLSKDFANLLNTRLAPNDQNADPFRQCGSLDPLLDFFTRPWFTRLWIVQEVLLARKTSCICGHRRVQFDEIGLSAAAIVTYRGDDIYQHPVKHYIKCIYTLFMALKMRSAWNFERALESSVSFRTSDPLDKIYAAMGFMDDEAIKRLPQSISCPNYDQKPSILYTKVTQFVLEHSASLRLLDFLCTQKAMNITNQDISCSSWVPRYDMSSEDLPAVLTRYAPLYPMSYTADNGVGKITEHAGFEDEACDAGVFALKGIFVDRVEGQLRPLSLDSIDGSIAEVMNGFRSLITDTSSARYGDELMLAMAICMLGGGSEDLKPTECQPSQLSRLLEGNSNFEITEEEVCSIIGSVFGKAHGRIMFRTEEGFLGSGPVDMEPGDAIYILFGSGLAFVLRQQDATAAKFDSPLFNLVGGAYVHGIMKGEFIQEREKAGDLEKRKETVYLV